MGMLAVLAGIIVAYEVVCGSLRMVSIVLGQHWLKILLVLWAAPLAVAAIGFGAEIARDLLERYCAPKSTWRWIDPSSDVGHRGID